LNLGNRYQFSNKEFPYLPKWA